jgi:hypothetical protein
MWTGSWLAYDEILRNSAIGAARFLNKATMRPHVVRVATTGKGVTTGNTGQGVTTTTTNEGNRLHLRCECLLQFQGRPALNGGRRCQARATMRIIFDPERTGAGLRVRLHRLRSKQCLIVRFDSSVAFADGFLQGFDIGDLNVASRILYHSSLLKRARMQRYAGSFDA